MLYHDRIFVREEIDPAKSKNCKECMVCHYCYFNIGFEL